MQELTKEKRISQERERLMDIFSGIDENKLQVVTPLIARAAFITVSLEDLESDLNRDGWVEAYTNGANQGGIKKSAAADCHISLTKNLNAITKQLIDIVPPAQRRSKLEALRDE